MVSISDIPDWLFPVPEGILYYERDRGWLHLFNPSGLVAWNLILSGLAPNAVARFLESRYDLPEAPFREVESIVDQLTRTGLIADDVCATQSISEDGLWERSQMALREARNTDDWERPSLLSLPLDGLTVTSAKCSSRWANLDDNTYYQPRSGREGA